ncbi:hypothetical protein E5843_02960 [Luteimonas yindakuii]|uniref:hypothetical protein n=1 Tax=Luteimonas yindakuii TaxID=2565782 RepID=UPI0010A3D71B|nr:hypothetical protein [Luteimonas yindakuii]QCO66997.1 hypothetical protein E5843_02960 [Luteimonas yindakuii]
MMAETPPLEVPGWFAQDIGMMSQRLRMILCFVDPAGSDGSGPRPDDLRRLITSLVNQVDGYARDGKRTSSTLAEVSQLAVLYQALFSQELADSIVHEEILPAEYLPPDDLIHSIGARIGDLLRAALARLKLDAGEMMNRFEVGSLLPIARDGAEGKFIRTGELCFDLEDGRHMVSAGVARVYLEANGFTLTRLVDTTPIMPLR